MSLVQCLRTMEAACGQLGSKRPNAPPTGCNSMGCNSMGCNSMGCNSMGCNSMGCNSMGCNSMGCNYEAVENFPERESNYVFHVVGDRRFTPAEIFNTLLSSARRVDTKSINPYPTGNSMWLQRKFSLPAYRRGYHLVTVDVLAALPEIEELSVGILHLFLQHTSASLTINENADPDVRTDMESLINAIVPERFPYVHTLEGPDDMPAHMKASLMGNSVSLPIGDGRLQLGTWQGVYLCEHRNRAGSRNLVATIHGERRGKGV